jgi:hypothetical protein
MGWTCKWNARDPAMTPGMADIVGGSYGIILSELPELDLDSSPFSENMFWFK